MKVKTMSVENLKPSYRLVFQDLNLSSEQYAFGLDDVSTMFQHEIRKILHFLKYLRQHFPTAKFLYG